MVGRWHWLLVGWLLLPGASRGSEADLKQAAQLSAEMKYAQALRVVDQVLRSKGSGPQELRQAYEIRAQCLAAMGKIRPAAAAFGRLLALDPAYRLPDYASPKFQPPFEQAHKASAKQGALRLEHTPPARVERLAGARLVVRMPANPFGLVRSVRLLFAPTDAKPQQLTRPAQKPGEFVFQLPDGLPEGTLRYHFEAMNRNGGTLARAGSPQEPFVIESATQAVVAAAPSKPAESPASLVRKQPPNLSPVEPVTSDAADRAVLGVGEPPPSEDSDRDRGTAWYHSWWFWTGVGVLVAGSVATGLAVGLSGDSGGPLEFDVTLR